MRRILPGPRKNDSNGDWKEHRGSSIRRRSFELSLFAIRAIHGHASKRDTIFRGIPRDFHSNPPPFLPREIRGEVEWAKWSGEREPLRTLKKLINSISENRLIGLSWRLKTGLWRLMKSIVEPVCWNVLKNRRRNDWMEVWIEWFFLKFKDFFFFFFRNVEFNSRTFVSAKVSTFGRCSFYDGQLSSNHSRRIFSTENLEKLEL